MAIKHKAVKASGDAGLASEWNDDHEITGDVDWNNKKIINLATPTADAEATTKKYVDGKVSLVKGETSYWTCAGCQFHADYDSSYPRQWEYGGGSFWSYTNNTKAYGSIDGIPDGSVITGVVVYGTFGGNWQLFRKDLSTGTMWEMACATANTEDTSINNPTIDHIHNAYFLLVNGIDVDEVVRGARIKFTYP